MSSNSSSSSSSSSNSFLLSPPSLSIFGYSQLHNCLSSTLGATSFTIVSVIIIILFLPLCIFVLYLGFQHRRSGATMSHSDHFTFHTVVMELINVFGSAFLCCIVHIGLSEVLISVNMAILTIPTSGQLFLHVLTCVERYLAVVHPITYRGLRNTVGIRIRNVALACVWPLSIIETSFLYQPNGIVIIIISSTSLISCINIVSFCSVSVLWVLRRSGPAGEGVGRQPVDQSKLRAFYTITAILGVLLLQLAGNTIITVLYSLGVGGETERCLMNLAAFSVCLPSRAVPPLLYLHRAGKLACCKTKRCESGRENEATRS